MLKLKTKVSSFKGRSVKNLNSCSGFRLFRTHVVELLKVSVAILMAAVILASVEDISFRAVKD